MTTERKAGWYHVKTGVGWECAEWDGRGWTITMAGGYLYGDSDFVEIGDRIPAPGEGWQCVPTSETDEMVEQGAQAIVSWDGGCTWPESWGMDAERHRRDCRKAWRSMLAAAPKP